MLTSAQPGIREREREREREGWGEREREKQVGARDGMPFRG
jgi:hypothetical protein